MQDTASFTILTADRFPEEVVITDSANSSTGQGDEEASAENDDDFFSSWDKPTIKRPSNPPSRTATPSQVNRTASPFLNAPNGNGVSRPKSPLVSGGDASGSTPKAIPSAAVRKGPVQSAAARKTNILGAKKTTKLGVKKVATEDLDFDAAEKKAKEEADRIEKLGYDPDADNAPTSAKSKAGAASNVLSPTPVSPARGGFGSTQSKDNSEMERLGTGVQRLGFGQMAAPKASTASVPRKMGFGSVGSSRGAQGGELLARRYTSGVLTLSDESERTARDKFGTQKGISSDEFFGRAQFDPSAQSEAKSRLQGFEGATSISSNAYFGRPEEEAQGDDYADLESAAKDIVRKFGMTAGDDLENVSQLIGEGASRLQGKPIHNYHHGIELT